MLTCPYLLHALSPLHAGTGQSSDVIDLPIARMRSTGIPIVPGSSIKGVLRDARMPNGQSDEAMLAVFGPDVGNDDDKHAGALVVGDARLLALPVRSFKGVFAWVSSPLLLALAKRDLAGLTPRHLPIPSPSANQAMATSLCCNVESKKVYLEDLDLDHAIEENANITEWTKFLAPLINMDNGIDLFTNRFIVVDDETMAFLWETATQVDTRIRIDPATRTVAEHALWVEESLPPETLLLGLLAADQSRRKDQTLGPSKVLDKALPMGEHIVQFGGKATVGRGRCRILRIGGE